MKKEFIKKLFSFVFVLLIMFLVSSKLMAKSDLIDLDLRVGEVMRYDVKALGVVGLKAYLWVTDKGYNKKVTALHGKRLVYRLKMIIQTKGIIKKIYSMNDRLVTYIDAKTFLPLLVYKNINESGFKNKVKIVYYHNKRRAYYSDKYRGHRNRSVGIYAKTLDLVSLMYYLRRVKTRPGKVIFFSYLSGMSIVATKTMMRPDLTIECPIYFGDKRKHSHSKVSQIGSHTISFIVSNDKYRVPTYVLAESIQFDGRVKFKGHDISKFARLGAHLGYYGIKK